MNKAVLMILDGWGKGDGTKSDVIASMAPKYITSLMAKNPNAELLTSGENVGLPDGQMGNSEVGHLNIGAGRVVYQDLVKINKACEDNSIASNPVIAEAFQYAKANDKAVHFIGLVSDGGVHSLDKHLYKLCDVTAQYGLDKVYIHALTDGRDTDPKSGLGFMTSLVEHLKGSNGQVASLIGRYYGMDRDKRWERVKVAYDLYVNGEGEKTTDVLEAIRQSYANEVTDEFIRPVVVTDAAGQPLATIQEGDVVFCFNYRTDRLREITTVLTQQDMPEFGMKTLPLYYLTMTRYDDSFRGVHIVYDKDNLTQTLGEIIASQGYSQIRIAETEKYAHVTFFFNGGREEPFEGESRILIPSPKVATYDLQPEMSAFLVRDAIVEELKKGEVDFVALNFANGDMVGHTGIYSAIQKAVEAVDQSVEAVVETARKQGYTIVIIADHGNADYAVNPDGSPNTAHSLNPVPIIVVSDTLKIKQVHNGVLADVAPTILNIMGIEQPAAMTGHSLVEIE
ncbi:MAG: 2,3-bisphosphoglycerate-independent phosphoglycerate mutase [Rikenellaceae bacterium]|jgi:2,3-bisphosphoglycerate-independent phosphoglycerate mutase|nr:2,3-bisphosphoglycerate-independent phosphoglycerate mutase [Rikenellaceae bacterium]